MSTQQSETAHVFYEDAYLRSIGATICRVGEHEKYGRYVVLDKTICYPHGGGQKGDRATIAVPDGLSGSLPTTIQVVDTRKGDGLEVLHIVEPGVLDESVNGEVNIPVTLELNWDFRIHQMRLHTAGHLLHVFVERVVGKELPAPKIADLLPTHGLLVYETDLGVAPENMNDVVRLLNEYLSEDHPIATYPDNDRPGYRYWECDRRVIPCGGLHPRSTGEVGEVTASLSVKKGKTKIKFNV